MASTFAQIKDGLNQIANLTLKNRQYAVNARDLINRSATSLAGMQSSYSILINDINQAALDNPGEEA